MTRILWKLSDYTDKDGYVKWYNPLAVIEIEYNSYDGFEIEIYKYENTSFHSEYCEEKENDDILFSFCIFRDGEYIDNGYGYMNKNEVKIAIISRIWSIIQDNK